MIFISAIFVNNIILSQFLGICPFLGVSKKIDTSLGICRELLGSGSVFGLTLLPEEYNILLFVLPPGAFIMLGFLIAIVNKLRS